MNRDSTKPQNAQPSAGADPDADTGPAATTHAKRAGPPFTAPPGVPSMWLRTPEDVLARIPFAIGFHPSDSLVVIAVNANGRSDLTLRVDLPPVDQPRSSPPAAEAPAPATASDFAASAASANLPAPARAVPGADDTEPAMATDPATVANAAPATPGRATPLPTATAECAAPAAATDDTESAVATDPAVVARSAPTSVTTTSASATDPTATGPTATDGEAEPAAASDPAALARAAPATASSTPPLPTATAGRAGSTLATSAADDSASAVASGAAAGVDGSAPNLVAAATVDAATAGFGRVTTDHRVADRVIPTPPGHDVNARLAEDDWPDFAHQLAAAMVHNGARHAVLVAYTESAEQARRSTAMVAAGLAASGIGLLDVLWVDGSRWRSLACHDRQCCPAEGKPYDAQASRVAAESIYHGDVAFAGEAELRKSIAPIRGLARVSMRRATARMDAEASRRYLRVEGENVKIAETVQADGKSYVLRLVERYLADGKPPTDDEVAWAAMYLYDVQVRDTIWLRMTTRTAQQHVQLWREVGRRALPPYHVAPLALLAFAAWLSGDGALARCATDRVLASDATYAMAHLIRDVVAAMVPPSVWPPDDWPDQSGEAGEAKQRQAE